MGKTFLISQLRTYDSIRKIATGQRDDYTTCILPDYNCFKGFYKMVAIALSKQQVLDADPKPTQQINFSGNLAKDGNEDTTMFFIIEEAKDIVLDFS